MDKRFPVSIRRYFKTDQWLIKITETTFQRNLFISIWQLIDFLFMISFELQINFSWQTVQELYV